MGYWPEISFGSSSRRFEMAVQFYAERRGFDVCDRLMPSNRLRVRSALTILSRVLDHSVGSLEPNIHGVRGVLLADHVNVGLDQKGAKRLGSVIRMLREDCGLTQAILAARAGISTNQLQNIEAGKSSGLKDAADPSNPRMSTLIEICEVLGTSASEVLARAGY